MHARVITTSHLRLAARVVAILAALTFTCAAPPLGAQEQLLDAGLFRWFQGDREIGRETFRRTAGVLESESQIPLLNLRLRYRSEYDAGGRLARFRAEVLRLSADTVLQTYEAVEDRDTLRLVQSDARGETRRWTAAVTADAVAPSNTFSALADLVRRAAGRDASYHVWSPELNETMVAAVQFRGDSVEIALGPVAMTVAFDGSGRVQRFDVPAQRMRAERWAGGPELPPLEGARRPPPDYSAPVGAPYTAAGVRIPVRTAAGDTFSLAATLTVPRRRRAPYPVAVTISGSGSQDRDENLWPLVPEYRPFRQIAERLAEAGIVVLRYDDRGFGGSTGAASQATTADLADDAGAAVAWLRMRRDVDPNRIVVVGHSEGGVIAPMLAAGDPRLAAIVIMAGSAKTGVRVLIDQGTWPVENTPGLSEERRSALRAQAVRLVEADTANPVPWMRWFRTYDPLPTARQVRQPVLILQGAWDRQISAGQADTLAAAMRAAGNPDVTVRVFPGLNHLFLVSPTDGSPAEYPTLRDTAVPREVLDTMAEWLARRLVGRR